MKNLIYVLFILLSFNVCYSQQKATLEDGTRIIVYSDKTWQFEEEIDNSKIKTADTEKIITNVSAYTSVYIEPSYSKEIENFSKKGLEILDYVNGYFKVKSSNGRIGYVSEYSVDNFLDCKKKIVSVIVSNARDKGQKLVIRDIKIEEINSASGVDFSIEWINANTKKIIKYIYFSVIPYNRVGDVQTCDISRHSNFTGKVTGPIDSESAFQQSYWSTAWYNNTISCIKLTKVRVEYTDGSNYTYVNELPKIFDANFNNLCK